VNEVNDVSEPENSGGDLSQSGNQKDLPGSVRVLDLGAGRDARDIGLLTFDEGAVDGAGLPGNGPCERVLLDDPRRGRRRCDWWLDLRPRSCLRTAGYLRIVLLTPDDLTIHRTHGFFSRTLCRHRAPLNRQTFHRLLLTLALKGATRGSTGRFGCLPAIGPLTVTLLGRILDASRTWRCLIRHAGRGQERDRGDPGKAVAEGWAV